MSIELNNRHSLKNLLLKQIKEVNSKKWQKFVENCMTMLRHEWVNIEIELLKYKIR